MGCTRLAYNKTSLIIKLRISQQDRCRSLELGSPRLVASWTLLAVKKPLQANDLLIPIKLEAFPKRFQLRLEKSFAVLGFGGFADNFRLFNVM